MTARSFCRPTGLLAKRLHKPTFEPLGGGRSCMHACMYTILYAFALFLFCKEAIGMMHMFFNLTTSKCPTDHFASSSVAVMILYQDNVPTSQNGSCNLWMKGATAPVVIKKGSPQLGHVILPIKKQCTLALVYIADRDNRSTLLNIKQIHQSTPCRLFQCE